MYILHNLARQSAFTAAWPSNLMVFEDKTSLLDFWARKIGPDFHELNVTGKDIIIALKYVRTSVGVNGSIGVDAIEHRPLKRYLVTDEHGRHLDIREWGMESAAIQKPAASTLTHCNGTKQCRHKVNGPSMRKRAMQESASDLDDGIHVPGVRGKTVLKPQDVIEKCVGKATCSKSWKDQSKAKRQYACHKAWGHHKDPDKDYCCVWHSLAEAGFPVSVGILADCA